MAGTRHGRDSAGRGDSLATTQRTLEAVFREERARLSASLLRVLGDFTLAEDVVQDALLVAWQRWPVEGIPVNPSGWLWTVARRRAVDVARRHARYAEKLALLAKSRDEDAGKDDRLALVFTCCHPALSHEAKVALTLRTVCGLSPGQIASAFLVSESAITQRLTRARRKIAAAGIPYRVPQADQLAERLEAVLAVVYLTFNEGYLTSSGELPQRRDLSEDAEWLAALLAGLMPTEPEVLGLLALIRLHRARARARFAPAAGSCFCPIRTAGFGTERRSSRRPISSCARPGHDARGRISSRQPSSPATPKPPPGTRPTGRRFCCCTTLLQHTCRRRSSHYTALSPTGR